MLDCLPAAEVGMETSALPLHTARPATLEALCATLGPAQAAWLDATGFAARSGQLALLPGEAGRPLAGAVLGLGTDDPASPWPFGALPFALPEGSLWRLAAGDHDAASAVLGWGLGAYRYRRFRRGGREGAEDAPPDRAPARLLAPPGTESAVATAAAAWRVRDLINAPPNHHGPAELAEAVRALAGEHPGAACRIVEGAALAEGFPLVAAVGAGSARPPRVAILEWQGSADGPLIALCGKGVCFDSGGLDLKPSAAMLRMKKDMAGAAVLIGVADLVMRARLPVRLLLLVGAVENAVSGTAMRPLDVVRSRKGLTVEIGNTDAEGRLVLADLLALAGERGAEVVLDCATLTGAARVALGPDLPALFCNDEVLAETLLAAGRATHDPLWRLPLYSGYKSWLDSKVADLSNVSAKPMAGAITAALFLQRFVPPRARWAHIDLYGWNDTARPGRPEGGEAQAMRALHAAIAALAERQGLPDR
ncbi:leucyl aminopeptidase family protein [Caldovatus aquaticus]|uniref:Leucyl aminopeptidase family protein n=1 Tax=Caldovatus aquaticus TaxID=2865671 RepID=A0ABS7F3L3_9PROT|nr:leucyl aminopeptidase family protein [Caldovatus aquaticus]MBW8270200.1 leucyl aminopeptidase family protein [Caldovatus aquaticus]